MRLDNGQAVLEPMFGNDLYMYLYEPMSEHVIFKMDRTIRSMISQWEPRIEITDIKIFANYDEFTYYIKLYYIIPRLNETDEFTVGISRAGVVI